MDTYAAFSPVVLEAVVPLAGAIKIMIQPIFIFSLPRSGSTLLQRILATHPSIATTSEPWLLLPFLSTLDDKNVYASYGHRATVQAINDFSTSLNGGVDAYLAKLRTFATDLYDNAAHVKPGACFFLDKTPRYHLYADKIIRLFEGAKFIFLWRNPLAVIASIIDTFGRGHWQLYDYKVDLFSGLDSLTKTCEANRHLVHSLRFEDLIAKPVDEYTRLSEYLGSTLNPDTLTRFHTTSLAGHMGDAVGSQRYQRLSAEPLDKWKMTLSNPLRKSWARRYLGWIGRERLSTMGYDFTELNENLDTTPLSSRFILSDSIRLVYGALNCAFELRIMKHKFGHGKKWRDIHAHT